MKGRGTMSFLVLAITLAACVEGASMTPSTTVPTGPPTPAPVDLTIYAAASLKDVLEAAEDAYETGNPGVTLTISTDSSAALATQIEQGAPADVFLSADTANPQRLLDAGLVEGGLVTFAGNVLVLIVPIDNPAAIQSPADLATPGVKIIAAGEEVPITMYANRLVANLAGESGYPADFAAAYEANIVSREDNVKAVVAKIELAEGDGGFVYATDAMASTKVATIDLPSSANVLAAYAGVVIKASANVVAASLFLEWLAGPDGEAILRDFGFLPPP